MDDEAAHEELKLDVERRQQALAEARNAFARSQPETREIRHVRRAEDLFDIAMGRLERVEETRRREAMWMEQEDQRQARREPPSLQQLVLQHGTHDKIMLEAWATFDAEMAEWKAKMRAGEFDAKIWR